MGRRINFFLPATTSITNRYSSGGDSITNVYAGGLYGVPIASGVGTADTLATVLSVTGQGYIPYLVCYSNSATPTHTIRCQVIVDGTTVFDATSNTITTVVGRGFPVVDCLPISANSSSGVPIRFNSGVVVKVASSQSGTDYVAIRYEVQKT